MRIRDVYLRSGILIITHPGSRIQKQRQKRGVKKKLLSYLFCSHKFHKIEKCFILTCLRKKFGQFSKNYRTFYPKICHLAFKNMGLGSGIRDPRSGNRDPGTEIREPRSGNRDPGSGIRKKPILDPASRIRVQGSKRHLIPDPQHC